MQYKLLTKVLYIKEQKYNKIYVLQRHFTVSYKQYKKSSTETGFRLSAIGHVIIVQIFYGSLKLTTRKG